MIQSPVSSSCHPRVILHSLHVAAASASGVVCGPTDLMARGDAKKAARVNYVVSSASLTRFGRLSQAYIVSICHVINASSSDMNNLGSE